MRPIEPLTEEELITTLAESQRTKTPMQLSNRSFRTIRPIRTTLDYVDNHDNITQEGHLRNAICRHADFRYSNALEATDLTNADMTHARFEGSNLSGTRFVATNLTGATGLFGPRLPREYGHAIHDPGAPCIFRPKSHAANIAYGPPWTIVKAVGRLPQFVASYTVIILLILYATIADVTNKSIIAAQSTLDANLPALTNFWHYLRPLPIPIHFGHLLLAITGLFLANLFYRFFCPQVVQKYDSIERDPTLYESIEYHSADNAAPYKRWIASALYAPSTLYLTFYLLERIKEAYNFYTPS